MTFGYVRSYSSKGIVFVSRAVTNEMTRKVFTDNDLSAPVCSCCYQQEIQRKDRVYCLWARLHFRFLTLWFAASRQPWLLSFTFDISYIIVFIFMKV
jgi:hypothetical protein